MDLSKILGAASAVSGKLANVRQSPLFSTISTVGGFVGGFIFANNANANAMQLDWASAWNNLVQGITLIGQGTGLVIAALSFMIPAALTIWNAFASKIGNQTKNVLETPAAPAVVAAVADSGVVLKPIQTTPEVAKAAPSENVIPATN